MKYVVALILVVIALSIVGCGNPVVTRCVDCVCCACCDCANTGVCACADCTCCRAK